MTLSVLPGGLRVVTESVPGARSASIGAWVGVGSVDESTTLAGASHYLEHLLFKGTRTRTGAQISSAIDAVGGDLNAFTAHEYTCYYAHVLASTAEMATELVCDVVLDAMISAADVDTERQVILEEIAMRDDDPEDTLADTFAAALFAGHPVAVPVIGSVDSIEKMTRAQIAGYYRRRYVPEKMVIAVAGGVGHGDVLRWVKRAFVGRLVAGIAPSPPRTRVGKTSARAGGPTDILVVQRDTEQAHVSLGVPGLIRTDPRRPVLAVLAAALGGGMSSRLFRSIREDHGLAYSCYASASGYADTGSLSVYAACQPDNLGKVAELIGVELADVAESGIRADELTRVKGQLTGGYLLGLDDTESRMSRIGKNLLVRADYRTVSDELAAIAEVTGSQVKALASDLLARRLSAAVVGPYARREDLPAELLGLISTEGQRRHVG